MKTVTLYYNRRKYGRKDGEKKRTVVGGYIYPKAYTFLVDDKLADKIAKSLKEGPTVVSFAVHSQSGKNGIVHGQIMKVTDVVDGDEKHTRIKTRRVNGKPYVPAVRKADDIELAALDEFMVKLFAKK